MPCSGNAIEQGSCTGASMNIFNTISNLSRSLHISVEGLWSTWDPWGGCTGTCDSDAKRNRTRNFSGGNMPCSGNATEEGSCTGLSLTYEIMENYSVYLIFIHIPVEGSWANWNAWGACSGGTKSRIRTHANGTVPCSGTNSETGSCGCSNPNLSISFMQCFSGSCSGLSYTGANVLTDHVPETSTYHFWMGNTNTKPQTLRILFSCAKDISMINIRNSGKNPSVSSSR